MSPSAVAAAPVPGRALAISALLLPCVTLLALTYAVPGNVANTTYAAIWLLALGTAFVAMNTWHNAQPKASFRQTDYEINHPAVDVSNTTWDRWVADGDRSAAHGRMMAVFALSVATTSIIVAAWLL
jgi:hypothetical protein